MSYALKVEQHHRLMYADSVTMVAQQMKNPIANAVTVIPADGEAKSVTDLLGTVEYMRGEARSRRNPENPVGGTRRWVVYQPAIESGQYIDKEDKFKTATDPTSNIVRAHVAAVERGRADVMFGVEKNSSGAYVIAGGGVLGNSREGKTPGATTALPAGQYLASDANGLTLDKLRAAVKLLKKADFGIDAALDPLYGAITPEQEDNLLGIAAASGVNLNAFTIEQLKSGKPTMLMGITWILTNRLPVGLTGAPGAGKRLIPIWAKSNIIVGEWQATQGDMWNDTSAKNLPYAYVSTYLDAVRAQDKGVVVIPCTEP